MTFMFRIHQTFVRALENDFGLSRAALRQRSVARVALLACVALALLFFSAGAAHAAEDVSSTATNGDNLTAFSSAGSSGSQFELASHVPVPNAVGVAVNGATVTTRTLAVPRGARLSDRVPVSGPAANDAPSATEEPALPPGASQAWWAGVQATIKREMYFIAPAAATGDAPGDAAGGGYAASNPAANLAIHFPPDGGFWVTAAPAQPGPEQAAAAAALADAGRRRAGLAVGCAPAAPSGR